MDISAVIRELIASHRPNNDQLVVRDTTHYGSTRIRAFSIPFHAGHNCSLYQKTPTPGTFDQQCHLVLLWNTHDRSLLPCSKNAVTVPCATVSVMSSSCSMLHCTLKIFFQKPCIAHCTADSSDHVSTNNSQCYRRLQAVMLPMQSSSIPLLPTRSSSKPENIT